MSTASDITEKFEELLSTIEYLQFEWQDKIDNPVDPQDKEGIEEMEEAAVSLNKVFNMVEKASSLYESINSYLFD